jgi:hypothetical protein
MKREMAAEDVTSEIFPEVEVEPLPSSAPASR